MLREWVLFLEGSSVSVLFFLFYFEVVVEWLYVGVCSKWMRVRLVAH